MVNVYMALVYRGVNALLSKRHSGNKNVRVYEWSLGNNDVPNAFWGGALESIYWT